MLLTHKQDNQEKLTFEQLTYMHNKPVLVYLQDRLWSNSSVVAYTFNHNLGEKKVVLKRAVFGMPPQEKTRELNYDEYDFYEAEVETIEPRFPVGMHIDVYTQKYGKTPDVTGVITEINDNILTVIHDDTGLLGYINVNEVDYICQHELEYNSISHPKHYTSHPSGIECIEITRHMSFNLGNAIKYIWRAGLKDSATRKEDIQKAIWYLEDDLDNL